MKLVGIIGGGNGGLTAAYHFSKIGNSVCLYDAKEFSANLEGIQENNGHIEALKEVDGLKLEIPGIQKIDRITTDIIEVLKYSKILIMVVPSYAQEIIFKKIYPYLDGHILVSMPGNFASLVFNKIMLEKGMKNVTFVDAISIPWACRIECQGEVAIYGTKSHLPVGVFPGNKTDETLEILNEIFPIRLTKLENVVVAGMENINFGGHPLLSVLNMGIMENFAGDFNYYRDTCSIATSKAVSVMEKERLEIGGVIGVNLTPELEAMNSLYNLEYESVYELNRSSVAHSKIGAPSTSKHRYITEDVPYLVVPCYSLGELLEIKTPMMYSCVTIAGAYNGKDYFKSGRNLEKMGIDGMNREELKNYLYSGK